MLLLAKVMKITESKEQTQSIFGAPIISARTWVFHFLGGVKLKAKGLILVGAESSNPHK